MVIVLDVQVLVPSSSINDNLLIHVYNFMNRHYVFFSHFLIIKFQTYLLKTYKLYLSFHERAKNNTVFLIT